MTIDDIVVPFTSESLQLTLREFDLLMQIALGGWVWEEPTVNRQVLPSSVYSEPASLASSEPMKSCIRLSKRWVKPKFGCTKCQHWGINGKPYESGICPNRSLTSRVSRLSPSVDILCSQISA